jgi:hypothetical protein
VPDLRHAVPGDRPALRPIVIVTNNEEKALPGAFLRRCVFHYIEFPNSVRQLDQILALHEIEDALLRVEAIDVLGQLREMDLAKKPGLAELLDWVAYLKATGTAPAGDDGIPFLGALVKQHADVLRTCRTARATPSACSSSDHPRAGEPPPRSATPSTPPPGSTRRSSPSPAGSHSRWLMPPKPSSTPASPPATRHGKSSPPTWPARSPEERPAA